MNSSKSMYETADLAKLEVQRFGVDKSRKWAILSKLKGKNFMQYEKLLQKKVN